jgi:hypothetical protein
MRFYAKAKKKKTYWWRVEDLNLGPLEDKELRFPVLPGLVPVQNTLSNPVHVGDLLQGTAGSIQGQGLKLRHRLSLKLQMCFLKEF